MTTRGTSPPDSNGSDGDTGSADETGENREQAQPGPEKSGSRSGSDRQEAADAAEDALARVEALAGIDAADLDSAEGPSTTSDTDGPTSSSGSTESADDEATTRSAPGDSPPNGSPPDGSATGASLPDDLPPILITIRNAARKAADRLPSLPFTGSSRSSDGGRGDEGEPRGELPDQCPNCGALLEGPYCSECGQKAEGRIAPLWHMLNEALEAVFELDLRVLHTLPKFLFLPGRLTKEYINGRRRRYIRPFRLYLFTTFVLFTTLTLLRPGDTPFASLNVNTEPGAARIEVQPSLPGAASGENAPAAPLTSGLLGGSVSREALAQSLRANASALPDSILDRFREGDSLQVDRFQNWVEQQANRPGGAGVLDSTVFDAPDASDNEDPFGSQEERERIAQTVRDSMNLQVSLTGDPTTNARIERLLREKTARSIENPREFTGSLIERMPYMMFLLLPVFALLLKLLYIRRGRLYMEHLIFTLHFHALTFFAFTAGVLMEEWGSPWVQDAGYWVLASPFLYLILSMRTVYEQGFVKTFFKACFLLTTYLLILVIGLVLLAILTVILM